MLSPVPHRYTALSGLSEPALKRRARSVALPFALRYLAMIPKMTATDPMPG